MSVDNMTLSKEERNVVRLYRRFRKKMGPKDALAALAEAIPFDNADSIKTDKAVISTLTMQEEATAEKYRMMLSMGIPLYAVEHKMRKDQVARKIFSLVVCEAYERRRPQVPPPPFVSDCASVTSSHISSLCSTDILAEEEETLWLGEDDAAQHICMPRDRVAAPFMLKENESIAFTSRSLRLTVEDEVERDVLTLDDKAQLGMSSRKRSKVHQAGVRHHVTMEYTTRLRIDTYNCMGKMNETAARHEKGPNGVPEKTALAVLGSKDGEDEAPLANVYTTARTLSHNHEGYRNIRNIQVDGMGNSIITAVAGGQSRGGKPRPAGMGTSDDDSKRVAPHWTPPIYLKRLDSNIWRAKMDQPEGRDITNLISRFEEREV